MKQLSILYLTYEEIEGGGNFLRCVSLARQLAKSHRVTLLTTQNKVSLLVRYKKDGNLEIVVLPALFPHRFRNGGYDPFNIIVRIVFVLLHSFSVIHGFGHRPAVLLPSLVARIRSRAPYVADWADLWGKGGIADRRHGFLGPITARFDALLERRAYQWADHVTVISSYLKSKAIALGVSTQKITTVGVGADVERIHPLSKRKARRIVGMPESAPVVVYAGIGNYDISFLFSALNELAKKHPTIEVLLVGPQSRDIDQYVRRFDSLDRIHRVGFVPHDGLATYLACGDVLLLPYLNTSINLGRFPNKFGDYLAAGRPIVSHPTGDMKKYFEIYDIGRLAPEDPRVFANIIMSMLQDKKRLVAMGRNARRLACKISWSAVARSLEKVYFRIISA